MTAAGVSESTTVRVDVSGVAPEGGRWIAAEVFVPPSAGDGEGEVPVVAVFCLPGGGMSRRYFDLLPSGEGAGYSMARHLAGHGFVVVTLDHLGVGESSRPSDPFALTPEAVADANAAAVAELAARLRAGTLVDGRAPVARCTTVGIGHSMGGRLAVIQQARHATYDALGLLGVGGQGIHIPVDQPEGWLPPERSGALTDEELAYSSDPTGLRRDLAALARRRYGDDPLPGGTTATSPLLLAGMPVGGHVLDALACSSANLLGLCGLAAMIPGGTAPEMAAVAVPVFIGTGERDITGPPHDIPSAFVGSNDVTLFILSGAGHNHNAAPNRRQLWDRLASWMAGLFSAAMR